MKSKGLVLCSNGDYIILFYTTAVGTGCSVRCIKD
jgi:hypothetical protein